METVARRNMIAGLVAAGGLALIGCAPPGKALEKRTQVSGSPTPAPQSAAMTVYRDPGCGCCEGWAAMAEQAGYRVTMIDRTDMAAIKRRYGVPEALSSCHTAVVGGYVVEGHVPFEHLARVLKERPASVKGIAVAGMPRGSPGMEMPDGTKDLFEVMAFDASGKTSVFEG